MKNLNPLTLLGLILSIPAIHSCTIKKEFGEIPESTIEHSSKLTFPLDWIGRYEGELRIYTETSDTMTIPMQLGIEQANAEGYFPWTLIYGDDDIRPYGLEAVNPETGHYRINEYNSIILDGYVRGNHFITRFSLLTSDLVIDYEKTKDGIDIHFYISKVESSSTTGGEVIAQDTLPLVKSYPLMVFQKAEFKKERITIIASPIPSHP